MQDKLKGKRLLVLGGSTWKHAIKSFAVEHGVYIVAAAPYKVGMFDIADEVHLLDVTDAKVMVPFIRDNHIDGVYMGGSEPVINAACQYLAEIGLPCYCTKQQWDWLQDKSKFKQLCKEHGLPVVPCYEIDKSAVAHSVSADAFPVITKPTDGCGSKGFSVCRTKEELVLGYERAAAASPTGSVICEKFVNNNSVVFFATFTDGKIVFSGLEDKIPVRYDEERSYVGGIFLFESHLAEEFRKLFMQKLEHLFSSIGIKEGNAWIEVFYDHGNYYFNEVGFRYGGSVSIYPVDYFYHINQIASDIYYALTGESCIEGHQPLIPPTLKRKKYYCAYPVHATAGTIENIAGVEVLERMPEMVLVNINKKVGDTIVQTGSFSQVVALVHFVFDTIEECKAIIRTIHQTLMLNDKDGRNLVVRKLDEEKIAFLNTN